MGMNDAKIREWQLELFEEAKARIGYESLEFNTGSLMTIISELLNMLDDAEGDLENLKDEFKQYREMIEENYRPLTAREKGWW